MKIVRESYSINPWRLVHSSGQELAVPTDIDHPSLGRTRISYPISGATRKECEAKTLALLERLVDEEMQRQREGEALDIPQHLRRGDD